MNDVLSEIIDSLSELKRMHQLNLELLEQLGVACGWILDNTVTVPNREHLASLLNKARALFDEIYSRHLSSDDFLQRKKPDKDSTAPRITTYLNVFWISQDGFVMSGAASEKRLNRLVKSRIHFCEDASVQAKDPKELTEKVAKPALVTSQSRVFRALADGTRLRIASLLKVREMCVCEITVALGLTQLTASHHMRIFERAGLMCFLYILPMALV